MLSPNVGFKTFLIDSGTQSSLQKAVGDDNRFSCTQLTEKNGLAGFVRALETTSDENWGGPVFILFSECVTALTTEGLFQRIEDAHRDASAHNYDICYLLRWQDRCDWNKRHETESGLTILRSQYAHGDQAFIVSPKGIKQILSDPLLHRTLFTRGGVVRGIGGDIADAAINVAKWREAPPSRTTLTNSVCDVQRPTLYRKREVLVDDTGDVDGLRGNDIRAPCVSLDAYLSYRARHDDSFIALILYPMIFSYDSSDPDIFDAYFRTHECLRPPLLVTSNAAREREAKKPRSRGVEFFICIALSIVVVLLIIFVVYYARSYSSCKTHHSPVGKKSGDLH